ncbi:uncharacterized protein LOC143473992 [Brachyhypopomus gauderio]|uniref:uncharacterized protein LOC143473992 n=1 Tax=Brachyhypopomus gauderio TaxID=698409 RepID=UPI004042CC11
MLRSAVLSLTTFTTLLLLTECSWGTGSKNSYNYDLSKMSDLTKLYNSKVYKADRMTRPLEGLSFQAGKLSHSGVRVTLADGTNWLVHKGDGYGISSQTVVVAARHMSSNWKIIETKNFGGSKIVSDFVKAGGTDYSLIFNNCHDASERMMND